MAPHSSDALARGMTGHPFERWLILAVPVIDPTPKFILAVKITSLEAKLS
jgi:hypothetical protein